MTTEPFTPPGENPHTYEENPEGVPTEDQLKLANAEVKAWAERTSTENKQLREAVLDVYLQNIGLKRDEGLGVAIAETYRGPMTQEALTAYASEKYRYSAAAAPTTPAEESEARLTQLQAASAPVNPPAEVDPEAEATAKMHDPESGRNEAKASVAAKMAQFRREHYLPNQE